MKTGDGKKLDRKKEKVMERKDERCEKNSELRLGDEVVKKKLRK